jgi:phage shock protein PspC (stress-responsive transcriptional regulator)
VCGGIARHYNLDPTLVRVGAVAGVVLWGASAVLYLVALLVMPEEPAEGAPAGAAGGAAGAAAAFGANLTGRNRTLAAIGVVVLVLVGGPVVLGLGFAAGGILLPFALLILAGLGVAWLVTGRTPAGGDLAQIGRMTLLGLGVLALLAVLSAGSFWAAAAGGETIIAIAVITAGVALVVSAFARPARWLILPALALAIPATFVSAAGIDLDGGVGEKRYRPSVAADVRDSYEVGAGSLTIDLRDVDLPAGDRPLHVDVGMGEAVVLVPEDVCVSTTAELGIGAVDVFGRDSGGVDVDWEDLASPPAGTPRLVLDADVGLGGLQVAHEEDGQRFGRWDESPSDPDGNEACDAAA